MRVSAVQIRLSDSKDENLRKALSYIDKASDSDLVVLPEMLMGKRTETTELYHLAEDAENGNFASELREAAVKHGVDVCTCLWEDSGSDKVYNTAMVYGSDGSIKAKYRKLHLFDALSVKESDHMLMGSGMPPVFECAGVKCGLSICYDLRFPEIYREQVFKGAELFIIPAAWYAGEMKVAHLHTLLSARALENTSYALCANLCGDSFSGNSAVFAPFGEMLTSACCEENVIFSDIDVKYMENIREKLPCLANIRKDMFYRQ
jgi:predicted amidohydrolase